MHTWPMVITLSLQQKTKHVQPGPQTLNEELPQSPSSAVKAYVIYQEFSVMKYKDDG